MGKPNPYTLTQILANGQVTHIYLDHKPELEDYYEALGDVPDPTIQELPYFSIYRGIRCIAYVHESGYLWGLKFNPEATRLWAEAARIPLIQAQVVGPLVIHTKGHNFK